METIIGHINDKAILVFVLRVILGVLFFFQGYDKVVKLKMNTVVDWLRQELSSINLPGWLINVFAYFTSYAELIGGAMLIAGLFEHFALYLLGVDLILVVIAFSMVKPMWYSSFVYIRLALLSVLLFVPREWDVLSADYIIQNILIK